MENKDFMSQRVKDMSIEELQKAIGYKNNIITRKNRKIEFVIKKLYGAFFWSKTPQGHSYWSKVAENLENLKR